ncbi:MAG: hypothetical protein KatS3mg092_0658 [Patescibacteria group bacterium]|nr:MAG: hypothetical protein KatS3mg092_0658 [Patescibacteria group bacterium]
MLSFNKFYIIKLLLVLLFCYFLTKVIEAEYFGQGSVFFFWQLENIFIPKNI